MPRIQLYNYHYNTLAGERIYSDFQLTEFSKKAGRLMVMLKHMGNESEFGGLDGGKIMGKVETNVFFFAALQ